MTTIVKTGFARCWPHDSTYLGEQELKGGKRRAFFARPKQR